MDELFKAVDDQPGFELEVDLDAQTVTLPGGNRIEFEVDGFRRHCLLNGLDEIGLTLQHADDIKAYETKRREQAPWLFQGSSA